MKINNQKVIEKILNLSIKFNLNELLIEEFFVKFGESQTESILSNLFNPVLIQYFNINCKTALQSLSNIDYSLKTYIKHGFLSRESYLYYISLKLNISFLYVKHLSNLYGKEEDFNFLLRSLVFENFKLKNTSLLKYEDLLSFHIKPFEIYKISIN